jgi:arylsulfatase A-like enzyme
MRRKKIIFFSSFVFVFVAVCLFFNSLGTPLRGYHIILITIDALRADHLSCYGYPKETSPFIDTLAKDAFLFNTAIAQSGSTVPSLASLFTSRHPFSDCIVSYSDTMETSVPTIAEFLQAKGYETYAVTSHAYVSRAFGLAKGFTYFDCDPVSVSNADALTHKVIDVLKKKKNDKKFFLWVHYREPHSPYQPPSAYREIFSAHEPPAQEGMDTYIINGEKRTLSRGQIRDFVNLYDANIRFADDNLRALFTYLKESGLLSKSIIIVTADHGESLGEHHRFDHNELYYGILRVPLIIRIPGVKGKVIRNPVALLDIFPTIVKLLGYRPDHLTRGFRGQSVFQWPRREKGIFSEYRNRRSMVFRNYRLFCNIRGRYELYDLSRDPDESINLAQNDAKTLESLKKKMRDDLSCSDCEAAQGTPVDDKEIKQGLRSLGYMQ